MNIMDTEFLSVNSGTLEEKLPVLHLQQFEIIDIANIENVPSNSGILAKQVPITLSSEDFDILLSQINNQSLRRFKSTKNVNLRQNHIKQNFKNFQILNNSFEFVERDKSFFQKNHFEDRKNIRISKKPIILSRNSNKTQYQNVQVQNFQVRNDDEVMFSRNFNKAQPQNTQINKSQVRNDSGQKSKQIIKQETENKVKRKESFIIEKEIVGIHVLFYKVNTDEYEDE